MKKLNWVLSLALTLALSVGVMAQDEAKKGEKKGKGEKPVPQVVQLPKDIELSADQKEKVAAINKEFAAKFADAQKALNEIFTPEQVKARSEASKKAKEEGKTFKDAREAVAAATKVTDDQKAKVEEAEKAVNEVRKAAFEKVAAVLTDDQKAKVPQLQAKGKGKGKPAGEKKPGKKPEGEKKPDAEKKPGKKPEGEKKPEAEKKSE